MKVQSVNMLRVNMRDLVYLLVHTREIREEAYAFACAMLIQIQKAMMELNQILRANEINFAILAALPTFFLSLEVLMLLHASVKQEKKRSSSLQATDGAT
ncbi:hypothetical protein L2E82_18919 [Cichorium intybus]|uniref:Uncharacterized protein n=1 Tax=Cichorium intybus TaxID=13427 RepID=A0ACB9FC32_CICIN|nr:hypothetical protein L2E82_18919 [Cichorium intybus]